MIRSLLLTVSAIAALGCVYEMTEINPVDVAPMNFVGHVAPEPLAPEIDLDDRADGVTVVQHTTPIVITAVAPVRSWQCEAPIGLLSDETGTVRRCAWVMK